MYIISSKTLYLVYDGKSTKVEEVDKLLKLNGIFLVDILDNSCIYYGSSFKGRLKGSRNLVGSRYKLPVIVSERNDLVFFPIKNKLENYWINFNMIKYYDKIDGKTEVIFKNDKKIMIDINYTVFNNQILKCSRLWFMYLNRV